MCLAIPSQIVKVLDSERAISSLSGVEKEISLSLLTEEVKPGDYVIIHAGFALTKLKEDDAKKTLAYFQEMLGA